jgi:hypothetical protein
MTILNRSHNLKIIVEVLVSDKTPLLIIDVLRIKVEAQEPHNFKMREVSRRKTVQHLRNHTEAVKYK